MGFEPGSTSERWDFLKTSWLHYIRKSLFPTICSWDKAHVSSPRVVVNNRRTTQNVRIEEAHRDANRRMFMSSRSDIVF